MEQLAKVGRDLERTSRLVLVDGLWKHRKEIAIGLGAVWLLCFTLATLASFALGN